MSQGSQSRIADAECVQRIFPHLVFGVELLLCFKIILLCVEFTLGNLSQLGEFSVILGHKNSVVLVYIRIENADIFCNLVCFCGLRLWGFHDSMYDRRYG